MNKGADIKELQSLLSETNDLLKAVKNRDYIELGELFEKRQKTIDEVMACGGLGDNPDEEAEELAKEILSADKQLLSKLSELKSESGDSVEKINKKAFGFRKYNMDFSEPQGHHLLDKRR